MVEPGGRVQILAVTGMVHHKFGSMERHFVHLAAAARERGHQFVLFTEVAGDVGGFLEALHAAGGTIVLQPLQSAGLRAWSRALGQLLWRQDFAVVHVHFSPASHVALALAAAARVPLRVRTLHSLPEHTGTTPVRTQVLGLTASRLAHQTIAVSRAVREAYAIERAPVVVADLGVDVAAFARDPRDRLRVRVELGLGPHDLVVGTVSRAEPVKDVGTLVRAMGEAAAIDPHLRLLIVGGGSLEPELRATATSLGLDGRVQFLGYRNDVTALLAAMDVFVLPSRREGFGLSLVEAACQGLPVLGSAIGGIAEIVGDDAFGWLFPPGDAPALARQLLTLAGDPHLRARLGRLARERADTYEVRARTADLIAGYEAWLQRVRMRFALRAGIGASR
jgi:glycosyltransferase involved in cell wall biosynthesis